jgi:serine/threonine protein kinase
MGAVYQARDLKRRGILCAVKEMSLAMVPPKEQTRAIQNFKIEAKMLWGLSHPNLPAFTNFFAENQSYFLVMEYIDGQTLEDLLERQASPFPERRVLRWAEQLCDVLEYLHSQHPPIIFRDMKPGNIMLTHQGHIKLIDFGIARFFRPTTNGPDTQLLGTPGYAPPEQYGTAQTDERSDIYSLGMTLFHLLTNSLSEKGFGVKAKDIRMINPQVSPSVARALEKATALEPEMRYQDATTFRSALCDANSFYFENGEMATEPRELAELCATYPEEAFEYLAHGNIDGWLEAIGEAELARKTRRIRAMNLDPLKSVEQFLHIVVGPNARTRSDVLPLPYSKGYSRDNQKEREATATRQDRQVMKYRESQSLQRIFMINRHSFIQVSPRRLDFGPVYPSGLSAPLTITISGYQGLRVSGTIRPLEPWIRVERTEFDGMNTHVNVRIHSTQLQSYTHYQGSVIISPNDKNEQDIVVIVNADIQGYSTLAGQRRRKTVTPDEDDEDDAEFVTPTSIQSEGSQLAPESVQDPPVEDDRVIKYGRPDGQDRWEPCRATVKQLRYQRLGLAFLSAFMAGYIWYQWLSAASSVFRPPSPWFIAVLAGIIPATTLGSVFLNHDDTQSVREMVNRVVTGMGCVLAFLTCANICWQALTAMVPGKLELAIMLPVAALGATTGTTTRVYRQILSMTEWFLKRLHYHQWLAIMLACIPASLLGLLLGIGLPSWGFMLLGMLLGIGIVIALILRVNYLLKSPNHS